MQDKSQKQRAYNPKTDIILGPTSRPRDDDSAMKSFRDDIVKFHQNLVMQSYYDVSDGKTTDGMAQSAFNYFDKKNTGFFTEDPANKELVAMDKQEATQVLKKTLDHLQEQVSQKNSFPPAQSTVATSTNLDESQKKRAAEPKQNDDSTRVAKRRKATDGSAEKHKPLPQHYFAKEQHKYNPDKDLIIASSKFTNAGSKGYQTFAKIVKQAISSSRENEISDSQLQQSFDSLKQSGMRFFTDNNDKTDLAELNDKVAKSQLKKIIETKRKEFIKEWKGKKKQNVSDAQNPSQNGNKPTSYAAEGSIYTESLNPQINEDIAQWAEDFLSRQAAAAKQTKTTNQQHDELNADGNDLLFESFNEILAERNEPKFDEQKFNLSKPDDKIKEIASQRNGRCLESFKHKLKGDEKQRGFK